MLNVEIIPPPGKAGGKAASKRLATAVFWSLLAVVIAGAVFQYSIRLAGARIYNEDECRSVCAAHLLAMGQGTASGTPVSLFLLPLMWLARGATHSVDLYVSARFFSTELFWLNLVLLTVAASGKLFSRPSVVIFAAAATLAPLWDFGFEIRPDNMALTGLLLMWCVLRVRPEGLQSCFIAGLLTAGLQFVDFKSLAYTLPLSLAVMLFPPPGLRAARWKLVSAWMTGAMLSVLLIRLCYGSAGLWSVYLHNWNHVLEVRDAQSVGWGAFLLRLVLQIPLLLAVAVAALASLVAAVRTRGTRAVCWDGGVPEGGLFILGLVIFLDRPKPSPHDLLYPAVFTFLLAARYLAVLWKEIAVQRAAFGVIAGVVLFGHIVPFAMAAKRYLKLTNYRQENMMNLAEQMTGPGKDSVYDYVGMVPTRRSAGYELFFETNNVSEGLAGPGSALRGLLAAQIPAVIIADNRFDRLSEADKEFIYEHFVPVSAEFWILGKLLPAGGGDFTVLHAGRYRITSAEGSNLFGTYAQPENLLESIAPEPKAPLLAGTLDGVPLNGKPVELTVGRHHLDCAAGARAAVCWLGPQLDGIPRMSGGDRRSLFVNWY